MAPEVAAARPAPARRTAGVVAPRHLAVRWLGRVGYDEAWALQRGLHAHSSRNHLLLLEHPHVVTMGPRAPAAHLLMDPTAAGAELCRTDRGGDVTYHGPGQLVGYPILTLGGPRAGGLGAAAAYVESLEDLLIDVLADLGLPGAGRLERHRGVWLDPAGMRPRKIAAIGVRVRRGRTLHGFALNVD
ncbi:MAG: lipoyl(octanoyl) transferase LipB, partial [Acidimicrobiia bacterium]|nr:lipoyl(octanoyl) transferase LipB [Acidimicrobiia bacterium]